MRYRYYDGFEFEANGPQEIAEKLWQSKFIPDPTIEEWMQGFARREKMWDGAKLRTSSVEALVEDLFATGRITPLA